MKPAQHPSTNGFLRANTENENVIDLPITRIRPPDAEPGPVKTSETFVASFWRPSPQELEALANGALVQLTCYAPTHAPIWVGVDGVSE